MRGATHRANLPPVCEVLFPRSLPPGRYQLALATGEGEVLNLRNYVDVQPDDLETSLVRYSDEGRVFGYEYAEEGLVQQIRLPVSLKVQKPRQQETFSRTLDGKTLRGASQAEQLRRLVSRSFPESFHLALYAALKHRNLCIDNVAYRCEGGYRQTDPVGKSQLM